MSEVCLLGSLVQEDVFEWLKNDKFKDSVGSYNENLDKILLGVRDTNDDLDWYYENYIEELLVHETVHRVLCREVGGSQNAVHAWFDRFDPQKMVVMVEGMLRDRKMLVV
jgi:hypothetical protein